MLTPKSRLLLRSGSCGKVEPVRKLLLSSAGMRALVVFALALVATTARAYCQAQGVFTITCSFEEPGYTNRPPNDFKIDPVNNAVVWVNPPYSTESRATEVEITPDIIKAAFTRRAFSTIHLYVDRHTGYFTAGDGNNSAWGHCKKAEDAF